MGLKHTYSLIATNPKLTGNIKLIVNDDSLYLESIDANKELTLNKFKANKVNEDSSYSNDVFNFFKGVNSKTVFAIKDNDNFNAIKQEYNEQYYTNYQYSCYPKISKEYEEQIGYFAPICIEDSIPEYFCIYKLPKVVSVSTKNANDSELVDIENEIYGDENYFYKSILKDAKIHKVFSLKENTSIGKYLRKHKSDISSIESHLHISFEDDSNCYVNGISLSKGGIVSKKIDLFKDLIVDKPILEFDNTITNLFSKNGIVAHNIINIEFLFDDESDEDFTINRYFGFYCDKIPYSNFKLDSNLYYQNRNKDVQNQFMVSKDTFKIDQSTSIEINNENGAILYTNDDVIKSSDIFEGEYLPYVKSSSNKFFSMSNNINFDINSIQLKDKNVNISDFIGFQNVGYINANKLNDYRKSQVVFNVNSNLVDVEFRLKFVDENDDRFNKNYIFISDSSLTKGSFIGNKFSSLGTINDSIIALVNCINNLSDIDDDFGMTASYYKNKLILQSRVSNEFGNTYQYLIYSKNKLDIETLKSSDIFISINDYNSLYRNTSANFKEYSFIDNTMFTNTGFISQGTFKGGSSKLTNNVLIDMKYIDFISNEFYVKTSNWYSKIDSITYLINNENLESIEEYFIVSCDDIYVNNSGSIQLYELSNNECGLLDVYHMKQYDTTNFISDYGKNTDGFIDKLKESIEEKLVNDNTELTDEISNDIEEFSKSGFSSLTNEVEKINNEYDRLKENEVAELSVNGRLIPFINKWVYDDFGKDVKENDYRLNTNSAFNFSNFSSSDYHKIRSVNYNTHEWYYLNKYPNYLSDEDKINTYSYFNNDLSIDDVLQTHTDIFETHFTENKVGNLDIPRRYKYSVFSRGNSNTHSSSVFRGSKIIAKKRKDSSLNLNYNVNEIVTYKSNYFNNYKFSAILTNNTDNSLSISVIENKVYKSITFFIECNLDDYYLTRDINNEKFLDRCVLYILKHSYTLDGGNVDVNDVFLNGAFSPFDENNKPTWKLTPDGYYNLPFIQNTSNFSIPNLTTQINTNEVGEYNDIIFETSKGFVKISNIVEVGKDFIKAKFLQFSISGNSYSNFSSTYLNIYPNFDQISGVVGTYINGGYDTYTSLINDISYSAIFDKVNIADPSIKYISIDKVNNEDVITNNEFILEFIKNDVIVKANFLTTNNIKTNTLRNNDFNTIGSELIMDDETKLTPLSRIKGNYSTKVKDILFFNDNHQSRFNNDYLYKIRNKNVQFFSSFKDFALYKELYFNKVNVDNSLQVIELSDSTILKPRYWKINEITLDYMNKYIFKSSWDNNIYRKYSSKNIYSNLIGYVDPKLTSSLLGSSIINIPNEILLNIKSDYVNYTKYSNESNVLYKVDGSIDVENMLIYYMYIYIKNIYDEFVNIKYNFNDVSTFNDDIIEFIKVNILSRYFIDKIDVYTKIIPKSSDFEIVDYSDNTNFVQSLLVNNYVLDKRINIKSDSRFLNSFVTNVENDTNLSISFVVKISVI